MTRIFKFGGASVKDAASIQNMLKIVQQESSNEDHLVIVVSAMGKTTSKLETIFEKSFRGDDYSTEIDELWNYHCEVCTDLSMLVPEKVRYFFQELQKSLELKDKNYFSALDQVFSFGELLSTSIIVEYFDQRLDISWKDARKWIKTDDSFGEAKIDWESTKINVLSEPLGKFTITQGFIGSTDEGVTTTLGKEGSDFTAAILASCLLAKDVTVWKDVAGIMNADPKRMSGSEVYPELSYQEIAEMTYYGAKVIHPKTISPLIKEGIPLHVRSFMNVAARGTLISSDVTAKVSLPTFIFQPNQALFTVRVKNGSFMDESYLIDILRVLRSSNVKVNVMQMSALTFTFCFDDRSDKREVILDELKENYAATYNSDLILATIKNYDGTSIERLPSASTIILEQKSRSVFHRLYAEIVPMG